MPRHTGLIFIHAIMKEKGNKGDCGMNESLMNKMEKGHFKLVSIDLFSGPGGLCTGFKWAGILPLIAVEWTDTTVQTYSQTHDAEVFELSEYSVHGDAYLEKFLKESTQTLLIHGDINMVGSRMIKELLLARYGIDSENETVDVVSGGAPCESFSMAGTRTEGDERDGLFNNILRIARTVNTKAILFENVKGMFSKPRDGVKGAIFEDICDAFEDTSAFPSYRLASKDKDEILLKACDYGVPQARERLFLAAIRRDLDNVTYEYPEKEYGPGRKYPYVTVGDAIMDLDQIGMGEESVSYMPMKKFRNKGHRKFVKVMRGEYTDDDMHTKVPMHLTRRGLFSKTSVSSHKGPGHIKRKQELIKLIPAGESMKSVFKKMTEDGTISKYRHIFPKSIYGSHNRRLDPNKPCFTVTSHCLDEMLHPYLNRAITPREAARLQSFPDWYQFAGPYVAFHGAKVQDRYEQIGDAIPPLVAYALARQFIKALPEHNG